MKNVYVLISTYDEHEYDSCPMVRIEGIFTTRAQAQQELDGHSAYVCEEPIMSYEEFIEESNNSWITGTDIELDYCNYCYTMRQNDHHEVSYHIEEWELKGE